MKPQVPLANVDEPLVLVENLKKYFPVKGIFFTKGWVKAVDGVSFAIPKGLTLGLVGESGCGKTTTGKLILRLLKPTGGRILFDGTDITFVPERKLKWFRRRAQIIFQDPYMSLNPRMTIYEILLEPLKVHGIKVDDPESLILKYLHEVGLDETHLHRYPYELSGGQRQRVAIARALILNPQFIVLDEPTSSLDVSVQAQILNLLKDLQRRHNLTYLFITHDLGVVRYMSNYIAVMYAGKVVEIGSIEEVFEKPLHPYTRMLLESIPVPDPSIAKKRRRRVVGEPPSLINPPPGCRFHPRCPYAREECRKVEPELRMIEDGHWVACHLYKS